MSLSYTISLLWIIFSLTLYSKSANTVNNRNASSPANYVMLGMMNSYNYFGIPGLIFLVKVTKFCTKVGLKMLINIESGFFHIRQTKNLANSFRILQLRTRKITVSALTYVNFHGSFWNVARTFTVLRSRTIPLWGFCLIKYAHNGPFIAVINFGFPGFIFQA